jgi:hypothetical protein
MSDDEKRDVPPERPPWLKIDRPPRAANSPFTNSPVSSEVGLRTSLDRQVDYIPERKVSFWRRLLSGLGLAIGTSAVIANPGTAGAEPGVSTPVPFFFDRPLFPETEVTQLADEAIAAHPVNATADEKSEFLDLIHKAFEEVRKQSADLAKDIAHDFVKDAVEVYVLARVARTVVAVLRQRPGNPITRSAADLIEKLLVDKAGTPNEPASEDRFIILTDCTRAQARSTLHLAGYQLRGGRWLPLGIDVKNRAKKQGRSRAL